MLLTFDKAQKYKSDNRHLIGKILKPENLELLELVIIKTESGKFGQLWANQEETFEEENKNAIISDDNFLQQMEDFKNADLTPEDGYFFVVVGIFRTPSGRPRFRPLQDLLFDNA